MKKNESNNYIFSTRRKIFSISSIILGTLSLVSGILQSLLVFLLGRNEIAENLFEYLYEHKILPQFFIYLSLLGIFLGIITRRISKQVLVNLGITFSVMGLIILVFWWFVISGFSHMQ